MSTKKIFEERLQELEAIVTRLENGDVPLEEAISEFQKGMVLSKDLQKPYKQLKRHLLRSCRQMAQS